LKVTQSRFYNLQLGTSFDGQVFEGLKVGSKAVESLNKQMNLDEFEELKD
jgi:hypothetical protein